MHITLFWRNIEIAAEHQPLLWIARFIQIAPQLPQPFELEPILVRSDFRAVGDVNVDHSDRPDGGSDQTFRRIRRIIREATLHIVGLDLRENRYTVISWLAESFNSVANLTESISRE